MPSRVCTWQCPAVSSLVLCSGGIDSTTVAVQRVAQRERVELCFVDYGQPARAAERRSADALARRLDIEVAYVGICGVNAPPHGEIAARNLLLVSAALAARPETRSMLLAIHAGTGYRDCSPAFVDEMQRVLDFHTDGRCRLVTPFLHWSKADVVALARELKAPLELTHSCEAADEPCRSCRSCIDREVILGG
jgi:7-cyano-7-deazaguanine synthase